MHTLTERNATLEGELLMYVPTTMHDRLSKKTHGVALDRADGHWCEDAVDHLLSSLIALGGKLILSEGQEKRYPIRLAMVGIHQSLESLEGVYDL